MSKRSILDDFSAAGDHDPVPVELQALRDACETAGGQTALAKRLGLSSQGTISNWLRVGRAPAERVLAIEEATGVSRHLLRPDIYPRDRMRRREDRAPN